MNRQRIVDVSDFYATHETAKLAELDLNEQDVADAVTWARRTPRKKSK